ncbi:hypothetical protein G6F57_022040 [Rhizopus arrhizus]|nr:hypothetical protein G6F57_022040 [Rhizopus arrhizus]
MKYPLSVTLEDLYLGKHTKLALEKNVICSNCDGKGGKTGATKKCVTCNGRGFKVAMRQVGMGMLQQMQIPWLEFARGQMKDGQHLERYLLDKMWRK